MSPKTPGQIAPQVLAMIEDAVGFAHELFVIERACESLLVYRDSYLYLGPEESINPARRHWFRIRVEWLLDDLRGRNYRVDFLEGGIKITSLTHPDTYIRLWIKDHAIGLHIIHATIGASSWIEWAK